MHFLTEIAGYHSSVFTERVNMDWNIERIFKLRYVQQVQSMVFPLLFEFSCSGFQLSISIPSVLEFQMESQASQPTQLVFVRNSMPVLVQSHNASMIFDVLGKLSIPHWCAQIKSVNHYICDHEWDPLCAFSVVSHITFQGFFIQLWIQFLPRGWSFNANRFLEEGTVGVWHKNRYSAVSRFTKINPMDKLILKLSSLLMLATRSKAWYISLIHPSCFSNRLTGKLKSALSGVKRWGVKISPAFSHSTLFILSSSYSKWGSTGW